MLDETGNFVASVTVIHRKVQAACVGKTLYHAELGICINCF